MSITYHHYILNAISEIHPGAGKDDFSPIDQLIQRNTLGIPHIQYSSMKGCIREYFEDNRHPHIEYIFGGKRPIREVMLELCESISNDAIKVPLVNEIKNILIDNSHKHNTYGKFDFDESILLSIPSRINNGIYCNIFCPLTLKIWSEKLLKAEHLIPGNQLNILKAIINELGKIQPAENEAISLSDVGVYTSIEMEVTVTEKKQIDSRLNDALIAFFGKYPVYLHDKDFLKLTDNFHLPVIMRNKVKPSGSVHDDSNVWSEQVLPRWTRFYTIVGIPNDTDKLISDTFLNNLDNKVIALGGNLSVGYGNIQVKEWQPTSIQSAN